MSRVKLTNICGGELVCNLKSGTTLRLNNRQNITMEDTEITPHIETLVNKGLVLCDEVPEIIEEVAVKTSTKKKTATNKEKED